ncbi:MAG TPA: Flp family type IVb pilin [Firmicutes bacterium]|nr:Flp family type IVb pilin [Bacillota bacterium]
MRVRQVWPRLWGDEAGQSMAEYGLLTALIAVAAIVSVRTLGGAITSKFTKLAAEIVK